MRREPFAPVAPLVGFDTFDDVIKRADATDFEGAAYVFTRDSAPASTTADATKWGMVGIDETLLATV